MLKPVEFDDLEILREWRNDPSLYQFFYQYRPITKTEQVGWWEKLGDEYQAFMVWEGGKRVGYTGLRDINSIIRSAEFTIFVIPEERHKGYGQQALRDIIDYGFNTLNLNRIYSDVFSYNEAIKLYLNFGFKREGVKRQACFKKGQYWDVYHIGLLREEWKVT